MNGAFAFLIAVVFFVIILNFFMLFRRMKRDQRPRIGRKAMSEQKAAEMRDREVHRRIEREQEHAARQVELRNKTFELYEQVRRNAAERERNQESGMTDWASED